MYLYFWGLLSGGHNELSIGSQQFTCNERDSNEVSVIKDRWFCVDSFIVHYIVCTPTKYMKLPISFKISNSCLYFYWLLTVAHAVSFRRGSDYPCYLRKDWWIFGSWRHTCVWRTVIHCQEFTTVTNMKYIPKLTRIQTTVRNGDLYTASSTWKQ